MIALLLLLQLTGGISVEDADTYIQWRYPCLSYELCLVTHSRRPRRAWQRFERSHLYMERRTLREIKTALLCRGVRI